MPRALGRAATGFLLSAAAPDTWTGGCKVCSQEPHLHCPSNSDFYFLLFILGTQADFYPEERLLLLLKELKSPEEIRILSLPRPPQVSTRAGGVQGPKSG